MTYFRTATYLLLSAALLTSTSYAHERTLKCTSGQPFETFEATLDDSGFTTGSGYFNVTKPSYLDNYFTLGKMACEGSTLDELACVGFAFGVSREIAEVTLIKKNDSYFAKLESLKGSVPPMNDAPWPCTVGD